MRGVKEVKVVILGSSSSLQSLSFSFAFVYISAVSPVESRCSIIPIIASGLVQAL